MSGRCPSPPWHCPLQVAESVSKAEHAPLFKLLEAQPAQRLPEAPGSRTGTRPRTPSNAAEHLHRAVLWGSLWICDSRHIERPPRHKKNISFSALAFWTQDLKGTTQIEGMCWMWTSRCNEQMRWLWSTSVPFTGESCGAYERLARTMRNEMKYKY